MDDAEFDLIQIRIPVALKKWVETQAKQNCRSRTGEINALLKTARIESERAMIR
jgi:hypothetical protein